MSKRRGSATAAAGTLEYLVNAWRNAKGLFNYKDVDAPLKAALADAGFYGALRIFVVAGILAFVITAAMNLETAYLANFMIETLKEATGEVRQLVSFDSLLPVVFLNFLLIIPFGIAYEIASSAVAFSLLHLTGGKGTPGAHFQLSSTVSLAYSMAMVLAFFAPLPCVQLLAAIALFVAGIYLLVYVLAKAYVAVHGVSLGHALIIAAFMLLGRAVVMTLVSNALSSIVGLVPLSLGV